MKHNCSVNHKWTYNGMRVVFMENEFLQIGVLADRGSDIFQFIYKPVGIDLMLKLDKDIYNPKEMFSQIPDTPDQFEDYYYGGWQEILPNSPTMNYRGASLGQHGEVSLIPWDYAVINSFGPEISVKLWTRPLRVPVLIEKTLTLKEGQSTLFIEETLTNESDTALHVMWGHHIAFGLPFLSKEASINTSATKFFAEKNMPALRFFKPGKTQDWPLVETVDGQKTDASKIAGPNSARFSELAYLNDFNEDAFYSVSTEDLTFSVYWDKNIFKTLWYWQERYAVQDKPWWGKTFAVALEPWTSQWRPEVDEKMIKNEWLELLPRESRKTKLHANCSQ